MSELVVPFVLRGVPGRVRVDVQENRDPRIWGCDLLDASLPEDSARGFPVCQASIEYGPQGYARAMGWVQLVRSTDSDSPDAYELDPLALYREVNTPYAFFGLAPDLFDAPFRETRAAMTWTARSFLCASPDGVMSRTATPVAAFTWGFRISPSGATPRLWPPEALPLDTWQQHVPLLQSRHPGWRFDGNF